MSQLRDGDTSGFVTMADIYHELVAMRTDVGKTLASLQVMTVRNEASDKLHSDHESRLRALETFRWKLAGIMAVVTLVIGFLSAWLASIPHR